MPKPPTPPKPAPRVYIDGFGTPESLRDRPFAQWWLRNVLKQDHTEDIYRK